MKRGVVGADLASKELSPAQGLGKERVKGWDCTRGSSSSSQEGLKGTVEGGRGRYVRSTEGDGRGCPPSTRSL